MVRRLLALILFAIPALAQTPPVGTTTAADTPPRSYSATQRRPADETIGAWSCSSDVCDLTVTGTNFATGDWVQLTGTGGIDVGNNTVTNKARTTTTVTLTLGETAVLAATERFYLEGANCADIAGAWTAATASGTTVTFTSIESGTIASTGVSCTLNYAVSATKQDANTIRVTVVGAGNASGTGGTLSSTRLLPPAQGGTYVDPLGATVEVLLNGSSGDNSSPCGNGEQLRNFHSTEDPFNLTDEYIMLTANTNAPCVYNVSTGAFVSRLGTGGGSTTAPKWGRQAGEANTVYYRSTATLRKIPDAITAPNTTASVNNFNTSHSCTEIGISGPTTGHEGNGVSPNGRYIAIVCKKAASEWSLVMWDLQTNDEEWELDAPGDTGNIDYFHALDDGSGGWRWSTSGSTGVTAARVSTTITFTGSGWGPVAAAQVFRVEGCSDADFNRLYTIDSTTATTLVATDAGVTAASATGCRVVTQWRGVGYREVGGDVNPIVHLGAHGQFGLDDAGDPVWVGHHNSSGFANLTTCASNVGISARKAKRSAYVDGTTYSAAMQCLWNAPYNNAGASVSVRDGWVLINVSNTGSTGPNAVEASIGASYDGQTGFAEGENEAILSKIVEPAASNVFYRLAKLRWTVGDVLYVAMSHDKRYVTWPADLRYGNGTDKGSQLLIDLGNWISGVAGPAITDLTPNSGEQDTTPTIAITGTNMGGANPVVNTTCTDVTPGAPTVNSATDWDVILTIDAAAAPQNCTISVTTDDGTSNALAFSVTASAGPTLTDISPAACVQGRSVLATLTGTNFDPSATLTFSGANITYEIAFIDATTIIARVTCDVTAAVGTRTVEVTTGAGTSGTQNFTVVVKPSTGFGIGVPTDFMMF